MSRLAIRGMAICAILLLFTLANPAGPLRAAPGESAAAKAYRRAHRSPKPSPTPMALPPEVKAKVPVYKPGPIPFHDHEELVYQASWLAIPAAQARIAFHKKPKDRSRWIAEIWVETNAAVDLLYKMRDYMRENIADDTLHTDGVYLVQHENARLNYYDVSFDRAAGIATVVKKNSKGTRTQQYVASDPWGPLSGAMMALSQDFRPGKTYMFDVFSGSQRYVFSFDVKQRERIRIPLGDFDAWRIVPDVVYLSDGKLRSQARGTVLWISADEHRLPLRIESEAFIGKVRADLIRIDGKGVSDGAGAQKTSTEQ